MMELLTPAPSNWLLRTVAEVKKNKRLFGSMEDDLIGGWIQAATAYLETEYQIAIAPQTWKITLPCFEDEIALLYPPLNYAPPALPETAVVVKYLDMANVQQTFTAFTATKYAMTWRLCPVLEWPDTADAARAVTVEFNVGYTDPLKVPHAIRQAALLLASYYIQHRDATFEEPKISLIDRRIAFGVEALMKPFRVVARYGQ